MNDEQQAVITSHDILSLCGKVAMKWDNEMDRDVFEYYLKELRTTKSENSFFSLLHMGKEYIPFMIDAFQNETDAHIQMLLVEIIWQQRTTNTLSFLSKVLYSPHKNVWRSALDGFVALSDPMSLTVLQQEQQRLLDDKLNNVQFLDRVHWINEAIDQIQRELGQ